MIYYIFRHGETYFTKNKIEYDPESRISAPILKEGIPAIKRLGEFLKDKLKNTNYTSPYPRCVKTSEIITKITGKKFTKDERLSDEWMSEGKETFDEMVARFQNFLLDIKKNNPSVVAICTHGWPISILTNLITKREMKPEWLANYILPGELVIIKDGKVETKSFR